jgi:tetratricopeptide (TPR) repeat protein
LLQTHNKAPDHQQAESTSAHCAFPLSGSELSLARSIHGERVWQSLALLICFLLLPVRAASNAPSDSDYLQKSAELMTAGDLAGAEKEARLALRDSSTKPMAWATLGAIRFRQKRYTEASQFLNAALRLNPALLEARVTLGEVFALTGKRVLARQELMEVLRVDPDNREARFALAQLESARGNFSVSLSIAEPILAELRRSTDGILLLAKDYSGLKQKESLIALVHDWDGLPEASASSTAALASLLVTSGLDQQAIDVLEKAKNSGQVSYDLAFALANLYFNRGDLDRAFGSYEAALSLNQNCVDCLLHLAKMAEQQKDPEKALAYLIKAKRLQPDNPLILFEFGKTCLELDLIEDALPALQKASRLQPDNESYSYVLASANVSKKQYEVAGNLFQALLAKHPKDSSLNYAMGSLLFLEVRLDESATYLRRSVELQPDQIASYYYLAMIAEGKGQDDQAIAALQDVLRRNSDYGPAYEALGGILLKNQKYQEAQQALEKAVVLNPDSVKAHYQLGILLGRTRRQVDADKEFAIVQQLNAEEEKRLGMRLRILTPH